MAKAPKRKKIAIDNTKLLNLIRVETPQKEIMDQLGIKTSTQLKVAYANALMETGAVKKIVGGRGKVEKEVSKEVSVGKKGSLIIPKGLVEDFGFQDGDKFIAKKTKSGILLSRQYR